MPERELYPRQKKPSLRDRAVADAVTEVLCRIGTDTVGEVPIRRIGLKGLLLSQRNLAWRVGEELAKGRSDVLVVVPVSDKGWSAAEEDWPAHAIVGPAADGVNLTGFKVIYESHRDDNGER